MKPGGHVPLGASMMNARVANSFITENDHQFSPAAFLHGNTYAGHPLSCVAAIANLKIVEDEDLAGNAAHVGTHFLDRLKGLQSRHPILGDVRGFDLMTGIELVADPLNKMPFDLRRMSAPGSPRIAGRWAS